MPASRTTRSGKTSPTLGKSPRRLGATALFEQKLLPVQPLSEAALAPS